KTRRKFLWAQEEELSGGKCKVNWNTVCSTIENGGLGIQDLHRFGRALRLRWLWLSWVQPDKPWRDFPTPCDQEDKNL
uniref:Reverse transcriptase zinc-binding domain-containing protein n=1 Tax=Aegilops tauschii subsp. strangulata TaxID=200361 RepID=A0A452Y7H1_AEGTS